MNADQPAQDPSLRLSIQTEIDEVCDRFERAHQDGQRPVVEHYLANIQGSTRQALLRELLSLDVAYRRRAGQWPSRQEYEQRFPENQTVVGEVFTAPHGLSNARSDQSTINKTAQSTGTQDGNRPADETAEVKSTLPERIDRYQVRKLLGRGSFGTVFLAFDADLQRLVAIKTPRRDRIARTSDIEMYLNEARVVASLDHPHIVPVHDFGRTEDGLCFVVSKFIPGRDLDELIDDQRPTPVRSAELAATVADALHHAHVHGLVHRDIKPANILLDESGKPYVADFGLALREEDFGTGAGFAGTPTYMSPEQARGEGHLVDGRSDVFSLGVVLYQLLTDTTPFRGSHWQEVTQRIQRVEARPPRQIDDTIPKELERICLRALSKRATERYTTAHDMAEDLRYFLDQQSSTAEGQHVVSPPSGPVAVEDSLLRPIHIVPKGLRAFDAADADFFLALLPGPHDRDGLPESIRFWKRRIEETDPDQTFRIGLLVGPSGCGKSSLVKAGLLPRLADTVLPVYVEATAAETETRLLRSLRRSRPDVPGDLDLCETLSAVRRNRPAVPAGKLLIVLDQFEQWLHAQRHDEHPALIDALRQCDGEQLQCLLLVRDDFWLAVSRFMHRVEVNLAEGQNSALVDLFDLRHARKVLMAFGRAFGALPENLGELSHQQQAFLDRAITDLAQDGTVISVRLALLAEMVKAKPWVPATLQAMGGIQGVGVTFLDESFSRRAASPERRWHQQGARAVLKALLPEAGSDLKGSMRSRAELLDASGYADRASDFDPLMRILETETRLLTPVDPEASAHDPESEVLGHLDQPYYQLSHDYLVPSLREWLTRKQKETRRGRAELHLAQRAAVWSARPENRQLPSVGEFLRFAWLVPAKNQTERQHAMMNRAAKYHVVRGLAWLLILSLAGWLGRETFSRFQAQAAIASLASADIHNVAPMLDKTVEYRRWTLPRLRVARKRTEPDSPPRIRYCLALHRIEGTQVDELCQHMLLAEPDELIVLRAELSNHRGELTDRLWRTLQDPQARPGRRLRAACVLADYADPADDRWGPELDFIAKELIAAVRTGPDDLPAWRALLAPVGNSLVTPVLEVYADPQKVADHSFASNIALRYAADNPNHLAGLMEIARPEHLALFFSSLQPHKRAVVARLQATLDQVAAPGASDQDIESLAKRQANAAAALLRLGVAEPVWPLLGHRPDPRLRSYLIHRLAAIGADPASVRHRLQHESDVSARRALVLSLGEFSLDRLPAEQQQATVSCVAQLFRDDPDAGIHSAAEWAMRHWGQHAPIHQGFDPSLTVHPDRHRAWYVDRHGNTMITLGPAEFLMGSPADEKGRFASERRHRRRIPRRFAIASKEVTVEQFRRFYGEVAPLYGGTPKQEFPYRQTYTEVSGGPQPDLSWHLAAHYCNWLSQQDEIPKDQWCYRARQPDAYREGMQQRPRHLELAGYRLPTTAEWEYACRAGAVTSRYFGETDELLPQYAWLQLNSADHAHRVGMLKPNDFGLFDTLGNVYEWCDRLLRYPSTPETVDDREGLDVDKRALRGGSFGATVRFGRAALRYEDPPSQRNGNYGFRVARTVP